MAGMAGAGSGGDEAAGAGGESTAGHSAGAGEGGAGISGAGDGGTPGCEADHCECEGWWGDCDHRLGCEAPLDGPENCGLCGVTAIAYEHTRTVCTSPGGWFPICEPGFADCNLDRLDCETGYEGGEPSCLPAYLGSLSLDPGIGVNAVSLGPDGEIFLAGTFTGPVDFDPSPASDLVSMGSDYSAFVTKLDAGGNYLWTRAFGGTSDALVWGHDLAIAPDGSLLFAGSLEGNADLDPSDASDVHEGSTAFVVALSAAGEYRFGRSFGAADTRSWGFRISLSESGEAYVLIGYESTSALEAEDPNYPGVRLTKLDSAGQPVWSRASSACRAISAGVAATSDGVALALGAEGGCRLDAFPDELLSQNPTRPAGLLALFDTSGAAIGHGFFEGEDPRSMANVYRMRSAGAAASALFVAGVSEGKSDLEPGPGKASRGLAANETATFVTRLDEAGNSLWAQLVPSFSLEDMTVAPDGNVFVTGYPVHGFGAEILAFAPDSRSRFALSFETNVALGPLAANAQQLVVAGQASGGADIDATNGADISAQDRVFIARFALSGE